MIYYIRHILRCCLLLAGVAALLELAITLHDLPTIVRSELDDTRGAALSEIAETRKDLLQAVADSRGEVLKRVDTLVSDASQRTGEALGIAKTTELDANTQITEIRGELDRQLTAANGTLATSLTTTAAGIQALAGRYTKLPDELAAVLQPSFLSIEPEVTCRHLDGSGYGGCWHSRITGLFGEAEKVGGVFTQRFPEFSGSVTGIAKDVHTFTSKAVAPRGFWGTFKDTITTGSGVVRAAGAAGLF